MRMDTLSSDARRERMRSIRSRDTKPELLFRKAIWRRGLRFRVAPRELPGAPDLVFPAHHLVVFIDGDFWHGHQWRRRRLTCLNDQFKGSAHRDYWQAKIRRNIRRDFNVTSALLRDGWRVLRFWESDIEKNLEACLEMTIRAIRNKKPVDDAASRQPVSGSTKARPGKQRASKNNGSSDNAYRRLPHRTVAEFFAGIGLVRLALEKSGWTVVFANDFDEQKARIYRDNFGDEHLSTADIHQLKADDLGDCALLTASFPCNDLSVAGSMRGLHGEHSGAFWGFMKIVDDLGPRRPPLILLENVVGFLASKGGRDLEASLTALNRLGYACDAFIVNASSFVPQSRPRLFIVAKLDASPSEFQLLRDSAVRPPALIDFIASHPDIRWSIRDLPSPPLRQTTLDDIVEALPDDAPEWWEDDRARYFMNQLSEKHATIAHEMIAGRRIRYATAFRRVRKGRSMAELRVDGIAGCLRTPRGGSGRQILFQAGHGNYKVRLMTPRECARLQGVPDTFRIEVRDNQALFGFGDAVCVPVIEWIADNYLNPLAAELIRGQVL